MPRRTNTYAIRLAVEGGGQVKAELVSVGQSGEQSLKRIESAGERASVGLKGLNPDLPFKMEMHEPAMLWAAERRSYNTDELNADIRAHDRRGAGRDRLLACSLTTARARSRRARNSERRHCMTGRWWQSAMIALARSPRVKAFMQTSRSASFLARKYVAGETPAEGVACARRLLDEEGLRSSLFYLGEYVDTPELVAENVASKIAVARALRAAALDVHISVDPTQIGYHIDPAAVEETAARIAEAICWGGAGGSGVHCLMLDMEDAALNDPTIALHDALQDAGLPVALTLQAYLKRTAADLAAQIARGSRVRLVKGAFAAGPAIAYTRRADVKRNMVALIDLMLSAQAKASGFYPIIATHDTRLHDHALERARQNGWRPGEYELEMLLGVRGNVARDLARRGERVRIYVPFGHDWWPYAVRRIGENPANVWLLARSLVN